jgi:hypothetical protein
MLPAVALQVAACSSPLNHCDAYHALYATLRLCAASAKEKDANFRTVELAYLAKVPTIFS